MAKEDTNAVVPATSPEAFELTLDEFCTRLSRTDRRVELIGAFHSIERNAGRVKDTEAAFSARLTAFATQPA